jgi:hypothetical protein
MNGVLLGNLKSSHQIFHEEGVLFFPRVIEGEDLVRLREACESVLLRFRAELELSDPQKANAAYSMRHLNDLRWHPEHKEHWKTIMEIVADPRCLGPVEQIFRGPSLFRTTSLFFNPRAGKMDGHWHRDRQFTSESEDEVRQYFEDLRRHQDAEKNGIQFQIALVDNDDIEYVPFSANRYDSPEEYYYRCADDRTHCREEGMPNAMRISQRAGDAVLFNANGLHRGRYHCDKPRCTLMLTYTPRQAPHCDQFSYQPWMKESGYLDGLSPRARAYFQDFVEVYKDFWDEGLTEP